MPPHDPTSRHSDPLPAEPKRDFDILQELERLESQRDPLVEVSGQSNREAARYTLREEATLLPMNRGKLDDAGQLVYLRDVGRRGVGFLSTQPLATGQDFRIVFHRNGYAVGESAVSIRYSKPVRPNLHLIGANFVASAGLLTSLGVNPAELEAEYRGETLGNARGQYAA